MVLVAQLVEPWFVVPVVVGSSPILHPKHATLAQLVEHLPEEQGVPGSIPGGSANMPL